jgi:D,D-heptose 1,7-bisphosphate phosphatase
MRKAIFFDRDGVFYKERTPISNLEKPEWIPSARNAIPYLASLDYALVIITNQAAINRGILTTEQFQISNKQIYEEFKKYGRDLDGLYFCPHLPEEKCKCRKPEIGMLLQAKEDLGLNIKGSYLIGDKTSDIKTGLNAKCNTILIHTGYGGGDGLYNVHPDFNIDKLGELKHIL